MSAGERGWFRRRNILPGGVDSEISLSCFLWFWPLLLQNHKSIRHTVDAIGLAFNRQKSVYSLLARRVEAGVIIGGGYGGRNIPLVFSKFDEKQRLTWMGGLSTSQRCAVGDTAIVGRILVSFLLVSGRC